MNAQIAVALIALLGVLLTAIFGFLTWSRNLKYQILKDERDRLEKKGDYVLEKYQNCLTENSIDGKFAALVQLEFPKAVGDEFYRALESGVFSSDDKNKKAKAYFNMAYEISKVVRDYNVRIQQTSEFVDKKFALEQFIKIADTFPTYFKLF